MGDGRAREIDESRRARHRGHERAEGTPRCSWASLAGRFSEGGLSRVFVAKDARTLEVDECLQGGNALHREGRGGASLPRERDRARSPRSLLRRCARPRSRCARRRPMPLESRRVPGKGPTAPAGFAKKAGSSRSGDSIRIHSLGRRARFRAFSSRGPLRVRAQRLTASRRRTQGPGSKGDPRVAAPRISSRGKEALLARPNIVLVVVSGLRRDHVSAYGYPRERPRLASIDWRAKARSSSKTLTSTTSPPFRPSRACSPASRVPRPESSSPR